MRLEDIDNLKKEHKAEYNRYLKKGMFILGIIFAIIIGINILFMVSGNSFEIEALVALVPILGFFTLFGFIFVFATASIKTAGKNKEVSNAFKKYCVDNILSEIFDNVSFNYEKGISEDSLSALNMVRIGNVYSSEDLLLANYKGVDFMQSDVHIQNVTRDSEGRSSTVTYFKGQILGFTFNKPFKANIKIVEKRFTNAYWAFGEKQVKLEDQDFNDKFYVSGESEQSVFYILTPHFMEKMKKLVDLDFDRNDSMVFLFKENKLYIALRNNKNTFEHSDLKNLTEENARNLVARETKRITNFIDELSLDNDLFK